MVWYIKYDSSKTPLWKNQTNGQKNKHHMTGRESSEMKKDPETKNPNPMQRLFKWIELKVWWNGKEEMGNTIMERKYRGKRKKKFFFLVKLNAEK